MAIQRQIADEQSPYLTFACEGEFVRTPNVYGFPNVSVFEGEEPKQSVPSEPPLLMIEILSKDDRQHGLLQRLEEYCPWGVPNIWADDPLAKRFALHTELQYVSTISLADYPFELTPGVLFSDF